MTLTEFLVARIAEDEAVARWAQADAWSETAGIHGFDDPWPSHFAFAEHLTPARVLADCEAKRRIVEDYQHLVDRGPGVLTAHAEWTCRALATIYADHPDYDESWRP